MTIDKTRIAAQVAALHAFKNDPEARMSLSDLGRNLECKQFTGRQIAENLEAAGMPELIAWIPELRRTQWLRLRAARAAKPAQRHDWDDWKVRK